MPPLRMDRARSQCQNRGIRHPAAGRMRPLQCGAYAIPPITGQPPRSTPQTYFQAAAGRDPLRAKSRLRRLRFSCGRSTTIFHFYFFIFHFPRLFLRCFFNNVPHSNSRRFAGRRGGRITAIPGEVGFAGGAAVSAPPRHFPCPHKAAAAVRVYVLLAGRTPARLNPSGAASVAAPGGLLIQQSRRWQKPGSPPGRRRPGPAPRR